MIRKFIYMALLVILSGCTSGLSDSEALKIAKETKNFSTVECSLLRINTVYAAVPDSKYIIDGVSIPKRDESAEHIHSFKPDGFMTLNLKDTNGNLVNLLGNKYLMALKHRFGGACAGCVHCYNAFAGKGLLTVTYPNDAPDEYGFKHGDVKLTEEGKKYLVKWEDQNSGGNLESGALNADTGDAVTVKLMHREYTGAEKVWESDDAAEFYLQYYNEMTPFGEALYGPTQKEPGYQTKATYKKDSEGKWSLIKLEDVRRDSKPREF